ncbi:MAG: hypothetical protein M3P52_09285 [Actinomycetota bacterium]|nr:hypothetical protein [Actinomycetota bacterium]
MDTNWNGIDDSFEWVPINDANGNGIDDAYEYWSTPTTTVPPALAPMFGGFPATGGAATSNGALGEISGILGAVNAVVADPVGAGSFLEQLGATNGALAPIAGILGTVNAVVADPVGTSAFVEQLGATNPALTQIAPLLGAVGQVLDDPLGVPGALAGVPGASPSEQLWNVANQLTFNTHFAAAVPELAGQVNSPLLNAVGIGNLVSGLKASGDWHPGANPGAALQASLQAEKSHQFGLQLVGTPFQSLTSFHQQELNYMSLQDKWLAEQLAANTEFMLRLNASRVGIR